jgi:hypothetical protein
VPRKERRGDQQTQTTGLNLCVHLRFQALGVLSISSDNFKLSGGESLPNCVYDTRLRLERWLTNTGTAPPSPSFTSGHALALARVLSTLRLRNSNDVIWPDPSDLFGECQRKKSSKATTGRTMWSGNNTNWTLRNVSIRWMSRVNPGQDSQLSTPGTHPRIKQTPRQIMTMSFHENTAAKSFAVSNIENHQTN